MVDATSRKQQQRLLLSDEYGGDDHDIMMRVMDDIDFERLEDEMQGKKGGGIESYDQTLLLLCKEFDLM